MKGNNSFIKKQKFLLQHTSFLILPFILFSCNGTPTKEGVDAPTPIELAVLEQKDSFFYIDTTTYPHEDKSLPIGIFDSGTGGLTILNSLFTFDGYHNSSGERGADSLPDFMKEQFIYLADQANMPYGNYYAEGKSDLLVEHVIKDAQFLLSNKYYRDAEAKTYKEDKRPIKALVIACNTATAYAKENIEAFIARTGIPLKVIGVIDAGAKGALEEFTKAEDGSIAVFATVGTIASKGYERTLYRMAEELGYEGNIQVFSQGGHGLAEAVDGEPDYIQPNRNTIREDYRGPSLDHPDYKIEKTLMDVYNFNFEHNSMLCDREGEDCGVLQINSTENYVRYHLVSMLEKIRQAENPQPLKVVMLGCTHYPYMEVEIRQVLDELYAYKHGNEYVYRPFMDANIAIVDPAVNVAQELYAYLEQQKLFNPSGDMRSSEFYITVPNKHNAGVQLDDEGRFTYAYKYGRSEGEVQEYVKAVPFSGLNISQPTLDRLKSTVPETFDIISQFNQSSEKMKGLADEERIK